MPANLALTLVELTDEQLAQLGDACLRSVFELFGYGPCAQRLRELNDAATSRDA